MTDCRLEKFIPVSVEVREVWEGYTGDPGNVGTHEEEEKDGKP